MYVYIVCVCLCVSIYVRVRRYLCVNAFISMPPTHTHRYISESGYEFLSLILSTHFVYNNENFVQNIWTRFNTNKNIGNTFNRRTMITKKCYTIAIDINWSILVNFTIARYN